MDIYNFLINLYVSYCIVVFDTAHQRDTKLEALTLDGLVIKST